MGMTTDTQVRLHTWPGMRLSWMGAGAVVHSGDEPGPGAAALVVSPHGSSECAVVVSSHNVDLQPQMVEELADVLANGLPRGFASMRFVAWDGACASDNHPAPAHILQMRLGIDVVSAGGPLLGVPGGSLFTPVGGGPERPGGWWRFRTGVAPVRVGWRFPAPQWEAQLPDVSELSGDLVLDPVPAGLWLHRRNASSVSDLAYSVPADPEHAALILSHPSEEPLHRDEIVRGIGAIPAPMTEKLVLTPYGQCPFADGEVGPLIADMIGRAVYVRTGLPLCAPAGQRAVVTIDNKGLPRWRTFARELWHAPRARAPRTVDWINPAPEVLTHMAGAATFSLGAGWVCEVIQAGLWVRPEQLPDPAEWVRGLPVDVNRCAVVLGAPHAPEITPPRRMILGVLEQMPVDARKRAYLAVPRGSAPNIFVLASSLRDRLPETSDVELLGPSAQEEQAAMFDPVSPGSGTARSNRNNLVTVASNPIVTAGYASAATEKSALRGGPHAFQRDMSQTERLDLPLPPSPYRNGSRDVHRDPRVVRQHDARHSAPVRAPGPHQPTRDFATQPDPHTPLPPGMPQVPMVPPAQDYAAPMTPHTPVPPGLPPVRDYAAPPMTPHTPVPPGVPVRDYATPPMTPHTPVPPGLPPVRDYAAPPITPHTPVPPGMPVRDYAAPDYSTAQPRDYMDAQPRGYAAGQAHDYAADYVPSQPSDFAPAQPGDYSSSQPSSSRNTQPRDYAPSQPADYAPPQFGDYQPMTPHTPVPPGVPRVAAPPLPPESVMPPATGPTTGPMTAPMQGQAPGQMHGQMPAQMPSQMPAQMPVQMPTQMNGPMTGSTPAPMAPPAPMTPHTPVPPGTPAMPPAHEYGAPMAPPAHEYGAPPPAQDYGATPPMSPAHEYGGPTAPPAHDFGTPVDQPPTEFIAPPGPDEPPAPMPPPPVGEETTGSIRAKEIRSHRTGNKPAKREDDRTNTQELDRLLGFFDEIRRAKAWDEQPQPQPQAEEPQKRPRGGGRRTRR